MRFGSCQDCGRQIRGRYARCYRCNRRRQRGSWHDPERLDGQDERDAELGRSEFYVYVLETDYGHYVGHTANVQARLGAHVADAVYSTAGSAPELIWTSYPLPTRAEAARFEAALKSLRDRQSERFHEITGAEPLPFHLDKSNRHASDDAQRRGCGLFGLLGIAAVAAVAAVLLLIGLIL